MNEEQLNGFESEQRNGRLPALLLAGFWELVQRWVQRWGEGEGL